MKVGTGTNAKTVAEIRMAAGRIEGLGYDVIASSESGHNPFLPLVLAAEHTERVQLLTSIALAFVRSPMDMAYMAWDLQAMSNGRFLLGLGSQVRGHVVRRYGQAVRYGVGLSRATYAGVYPGPPHHMGLLSERDKAGLSRRLL